YLSGAVDALRDPVLIAYMNLIFAAPLWLADRFARADRDVETFTLKCAALVGLAQSVSLVPGVSRSGMPMPAGRALGLARSQAARFSMLLSIPILLTFGMLAGVDLAREGAETGLAAGLLVAALSFVSALAVIAILLRVL